MNINKLFKVERQNVPKENQLPGITEGYECCSIIFGKVKGILKDMNFSYSDGKTGNRVQGKLLIYVDKIYYDKILRDDVLINDNDRYVVVSSTLGGKYNILGVEII